MGIGKKLPMLKISSKKSIFAEMTEVGKGGKMFNPVYFKDGKRLTKSSDIKLAKIKLKPLRKVLK